MNSIYNSSSKTVTGPFPLKQLTIALTLSQTVRTEFWILFSGTTLAQLWSRVLHNILKG